MTALSSSIRSAVLTVALAALVAVPLVAQTTAPKAPPEISDNSFLVEEAFNQEAGVVQHIGTFRRAPGGASLFTFTQEWPAPTIQHQLSYTASLLSTPSDGTAWGDLALNYRYQAVGKDEERVWFAPRLSVLLPTGDANRGYGTGGVGLQVNLPVSIRAAEAVATHWNAGATVSRARNASGTRGTTRSLNAAASVIWLLAPTVNLMLESAWDRTQSLGTLGERVTESNFVVVPGVRAAINFASGMQIVPGVGMPISMTGDSRERDLFVYLSVEHAFR